MRFCWLRRPFRSFPLWKRLSPWGRRCTLSIWALTSWSFPWWSRPRSSLRGWSTTGGSWRSGRARTRCWSSDRALRRSDEWCRVRSVRCRSTRHSRRSRAMRIYGHNDIVQYLNHDSKMADHEVVNTPHSAWTAKTLHRDNSTQARDAYLLKTILYSRHSRKCVKRLDLPMIIVPIYTHKRENHRFNRY